MSRFIVQELHGCEITFPVRQRSSGHKVPTGYAVLDSAVCYRNMGEWWPKAGKTTDTEGLRREAEARAAELNSRYGTP